MRLSMRDKEQGTFVKKIACPECVSMGKDTKGDNLVVYKKSSGSYDATCFSCGHWTRCDQEGVETEHNKMDIKIGNMGKMDTINKLPSITLSDRRISQTHTHLYGVKSEVVGGKEVKRYYPVTKGGQVTGYKCRTLPKTFGGSVGDCKADSELFGQSLFKAGGKLIIVTEGEEDALAAHAITKHMSRNGRGYSAVSITSGVNTAIKSISNNIEYLQSFDKVVFCFDNEPKAQEMALKCCELLEPGKAYNMTLPLKDASDMCIEKKFSEFMDSLSRARSITPQGLVLSSDTWDAWQNRFNFESVPLPQEWELNETMAGIRLGGLYTIGAGSGVGKSTMLKMLQLHLFENTEDGIGVIALEEPLCDSIGLLMGLKLNKRLQDPLCKSTEQEQKEAWNYLFSGDRFVFEQAFGAVDENSLFNKIRFMVKGKGCKYIFLDHLTALTDMYGNGSGSKIEQTANLVAKIKSLTQELDCAIILVSHLRKRSDESRSYEEGAVPNMDSLQGSGAVKQYSDCVITISRDMREEPSSTQYHVIKNRLTGKLGKSAKLTFDFKTGWMKPLESDSNKEEVL